MSFQGLSTNGSVMLQYGEYGATLYDGEMWHPIYTPYSVEDLVGADVLQEQIDLLEDSIDVLQEVISKNKN